MKTWRGDPGRNPQALFAEAAVHPDHALVLRFLAACAAVGTGLGWVCSLVLAWRERHVSHH